MQTDQFSNYYFYAIFLRQNHSMTVQKRITIFYLTIALLAFCYVVVRAFTVGVTFDEVWTLDQYVPTSVINILNFTPCDANNHIVNTLLIKLFFKFGNQSLFVARLPNVLAFAVYLFFAYKISRMFSSNALGVSCFLLLILNPFVLDFFSIARGYGLSLGFTMASLYFTLRFIRQNKKYDVAGAVGFGALAVLSNFSILNYWLALMLTLNFISLTFKQKYSFKNTFIQSGVIGLFLLAILYEPIRKLRINNSLYYGGYDNFYHDTLISLTEYSLYNNYDALAKPILNVFLIILLSSIIASFYYRRKILSGKNTILLITILCILSTIAQHYLFNTLYLIDRTALFFYPLLILTLVLSFQDIGKKWLSNIAIICVLIFGVNFTLHASVGKTAIWFFDTHTPSILQMLNTIGEKEDKVLKIDYSWPFIHSIQYYHRLNNYPYIQIAKNPEDRNDLNLDADYYIYLSKPQKKVWYLIEGQDINMMKKDTVAQFEKEYIIIFNNIQDTTAIE